MNSPHEELASPKGEKAHVESRPARKFGDLQKTITMAQIAKAAGVSQGAISSLLNDRDYGIRVSEKTRERVFKVCRDMGYIPNDLRAVVRMYPELGEICLLLSSSLSRGTTDPFVSRLTHSTMQAVTDTSHPLTIAYYEDQMDYTAVAPEALPYPVRAGVASKFLCYGPPNISLAQLLTRRGSPVVSMGTEISLSGVLSLLPDYPMASRLAIEHLFRLGHEHIAIVSGPFGSTDSQIIELHRGVKLAYDEHEIPIDAQNIVYGDLSYQSGCSALDELLSHPVKPTAVFCLSDAAAAGVLACAQMRGVRVPEELSVVGCGDDLCSNLLLPALTTVHIPAEEMAEFAVEEIDRMVRENALSEPRKQVLAVRLIERGSSASRARTS